MSRAGLESTHRVVRTAALSALTLVLSIFASQIAMAQDRALIVAIDQYADERLASLPAKLAENDAEAIQQLLVKKLGFKADEIKVLRNEKATRKAILSAIDGWLNPNGSGKEQKKVRQLKGLDESGALATNKKKKRKKKKVKWRPPPKTYRSYFYFSGLGHVVSDANGDESDGYDEAIVPYDAKLDTAGGRKEIGGMILDDDVENALIAYKHRHVTLVMDTSHSGVVTRDLNLANRTAVRMRVPRFDEAVRSIASEDWLVRHKEEGPFADVRIPGGSLQVWSAASATQSALIAGQDDKPNGLFTLLYTEGLMTGRADKNANGIISNAELLRHVVKGSQAYCQLFRERCEMGLRPRLDPVHAYAGSAWVDRKKVTHRRERQLSFERLKDFLVGYEDAKLEIVQTPASPIHVGATGIGYEVTTEEPGYVILLNLTEKGELFQLYPNQFSGVQEKARLHLVKANTPLVVPEKSYGITLSATETGKGHIVALMTPDPVRFSPSVTDRVIASVSSDEAIRDYLSQLSAALYRPIGHTATDRDTGTARWHVKSLPYEVLPRPRVQN